tara:strand:+ start:7412 stop:8260 length:849 start_codon:yes stop_codon:yes gene_type:complete
LNIFSALKSKNLKNNGSIPSKLRVGKKYIDNLKPLGGIFKPAITKAGRLSLSGFTEGGEKVKIYKSFNSSQIELRKVIGDTLKNENVLFPKVIASDDNFIVEQWINGQSFSNLNKNLVSKNTPKVINFLKKIHFEPEFLNLAKTHKNSFCYLCDYLLLRLKPWCQWSPVEDLLEEWNKLNLKTNYQIQPRLSHPDLSLSNLILGADNKVYIVDNELIGVGKGWILDEKNSFFRSQVNLPELDPICQKFYNISWKLRLVGSALDSGDFARAQRMSKFENFNKK